VYSTRRHQHQSDGPPGNSVSSCPVLTDQEPARLPRRGKHQ